MPTTSTHDLSRRPLRRVEQDLRAGLLLLLVVLALTAANMGALLAWVVRLGAMTEPAPAPVVIETGDPRREAPPPAACIEVAATARRDESKTGAGTGSVTHTAATPPSRRASRARARNARAASDAPATVEPMVVATQPGF